MNAPRKKAATKNPKRRRRRDYDLSAPDAPPTDGLYSGIETKPRGIFGSYTEARWSEEFMRWDWDATYVGDKVAHVDFIVKESTGNEFNVEVKPNVCAHLASALARIAEFESRENGGEENKHQLSLLIGGNPGFEQWFLVAGFHIYRLEGGPKPGRTERAVAKSGATYQQRYDCELPDLFVSRVLEAPQTCLICGEQSLSIGPKQTIVVPDAVVADDYDYYEDYADVAECAATQIDLPYFGIRVHLDGEGGGIVEMGELAQPAAVPKTENTPERAWVGGTVDMLEKLLLAHANAGVDITSPAYGSGVKQAVFGLGLQQAGS